MVEAACEPWERGPLARIPVHEFGTGRNLFPARQRAGDRGENS